jgi:hypothetical protein
MTIIMSQHFIMNLSTTRMGTRHKSQRDATWCRDPSLFVAKELSRIE